MKEEKSRLIIWKKTGTMRIVKQRSRLAREVMQSLSLEVFKTTLNKL